MSPSPTAVPLGPLAHPAPDAELWIGEGLKELVMRHLVGVSGFRKSRSPQDHQHQVPAVVHQMCFAEQN